MGAILEGAELLKDPVYAVVFAIICYGFYRLFKWVVTDDEE
jgi:uncharacterized membrane protein